MLQTVFRFSGRRTLLVIPWLAVMAVLIGGISQPAHAMDAIQSGALPAPLPLFPPDNWWNRDISSWPVDADSASYISFINHGGTRHLHPDFGGDAPTQRDPYGIYGMPYVVVSGATTADLVAVEFDYSSESDGVDHATDKSYPFYPIPLEAITQPHWIEGGDPGDVDLRGSQDRHLLIVDYDRHWLYELYNVYYNGQRRQWYAGSGAFFDLNRNDRRPDGWTSADAAGLAMLPGLVRYDEVYGSTVSEIRHAFRVTMRATNGYVYPASHRAGSTRGALPMGARLRLKASVDVTQRTSDPNIQKIFRAMQKYGLIVADNGSDMFITGTYDTRWDNDILNSAFSALTASDFEVIRLGYEGPLRSAMVTLNGAAFHPGQIMLYQATLSPGSTPTQVDIYLGTLLPDGITFLSLVKTPPDLISIALGPSPIPYLANVPLTQAVIPFSYTFGGSEPVGKYVTYAGFAAAGANPTLSSNQLSLAVAAFQFAP